MACSGCALPLPFTYLLSAVELSLGGSSPYTARDKTNNNKYNKRNNTKTQYKQYKT
jgi:hypothetical protein